ncbi:MAG: RluA family pseudouridine synthase, partial [Prochlorothrix sp.]
LLHFAASAGLRPLGLAEFWWERGEVGEVGEEEEVEEWGSSRRRSGQFYGACRERCQPIRGHPPVVDPVSGRGHPPVVALVSGRDNPPVVDPILAMFDPPLGHNKPEPLRILYQDPWLIVVDKPAGLLSVPGRRQWDSVVSRLRCGPGLGRTIGAENEPDGPEDLRAVHRLDQETSGVLVIARDRASHRHLSQQFHDRRIEKIYFAIVRGQIQPQSGTIDLPLWGDPQQRPRQVVHNQRGKPSQTQYQVQEIFPYHGQIYSRLELRPQTGRTHQLRVHLADPLGLGSAIVGDRLYGNSPSHDRQPPDRLGNAAVTEAATTPAQQPWGDRLHLHAHRLSFTHPHTGQPLEITAPPPRSI